MWDGERFAIVAKPSRPGRVRRLAAKERGGRKGKAGFCQVEKTIELPAHNKIIVHTRVGDAPGCRRVPERLGRQGKLKSLDTFRLRRLATGLADFRSEHDVSIGAQRLGEFTVRRRVRAGFIKDDIKDDCFGSCRGEPVQ